jgi:hypothetical protein
MKTRFRTTALAFATAFGALAALPLAAHAADSLPGQPGADTTVSAREQRSAPYMIMVMTSTGMMTERQITAKVATELMKHAKPLNDTMVLVHDGKAWIVDDMKMADGHSFREMLKTPESMGF